MKNSRIEWTDASLQVTTGCTKISPGCDHCYALPLSARLAGNPALAAGQRKAYGNAIAKDKANKLIWSRKITEMPGWWEKLEQLCKGRPKKIFINSMSDLFHSEVSGDLFIRVLGACAKHPEHTFQLLTKRPRRALRRCREYDLMPLGFQMADGVTPQLGSTPSGEIWPKNLWMGATVCNQDEADRNITILRRIKAKVRYISFEPALRPLDLAPWIGTHNCTICYERFFLGDCPEGPRDEDGAYTCPDCGSDEGVDTWDSWMGRGYDGPGLDWVICGCESGPGARPMDIAWARNLKNQCEEAGVPFFYKQGPGDDGKVCKMPILDGRQWAQFPEVGQR